MLHIYHWVLMPNHYHAVLELENPAKISSLMAGVGRSCTCSKRKFFLTFLTQ
ncbi:MAG: hypothetical protein KKD55_00110 [Candidatus Omnitrophica bacterium]|nr:hypothetical protein [Candidatus Omnitrophota bacterium]